MKALKIIFIANLLTYNLPTFGQLNPVCDFSFQQSYDYGNFFCPSFTCFTLAWNCPNSTNDTLKGFNIYKDCIFWKFSTTNIIACEGVSPCIYNDFYYNYPFWITVKAVYNQDSIESIANDSIFVQGAMTNIEGSQKGEAIILKNPVKKHENISIMIPNIEKCNLLIQVISPTGQIINNYIFDGKCNNSTINISTENLFYGIYLIKIQYGSKFRTLKVMIE